MEVVKALEEDHNVEDVKQDMQNPVQLYKEDSSGRQEICGMVALTWKVPRY